MNLDDQFPVFTSKINKLNIEQKKEALTDKQIKDLEVQLNIKLPPSYKKFLKCTGGFWAFDGAVQLDGQHPFIHKFKPYNQYTEQQKNTIDRKGGTWPPPSHGMLCFAEFFMEADGDQVLFDIKQRNECGEYPVYYYAHEDHPPTIRKIADSFEQWLNEFPDYEEFNEE